MDFRYFFRLLSYFTFPRIFNLLKISFSYFWAVVFKRYKSRALPWALSVESVNTCNLKCPECPTGIGGLSRPKGQLPLDKFEKILPQISATTFHLLLYFQGEPFLYRHLNKALRMAKDFKIFTALSTNGHFLNEENCKGILDAGLQRIIISVDGTTQESYAKYRVGGNLEKVKQGIITLVDMKRKRRLQHPQVVLQFLIFKHNQHQIKEMKQLAKELGVDRLEFKKAQFYNRTKDNELIPDEVHSQYRLKGDSYVLKKPLRNRCFRLWSTAVICYNGDLVPCCYDKDAQYIIGNVFTDTFKDIWQGEKAFAFCQKVFSNKKAIEICNECGE